MISADTWTKVTLATELHDTDGHFASNAFTCVTAGKYLIYGSVNVHSSDNNISDTRCKIYKNGAAYFGNYQFITSGGSVNYRHLMPTIMGIDDADADDYYELYVSASGTSPSVAHDVETALSNKLVGFKLIE